MALLLNEIQEILKSPKKKQVIAKAVRHENRLRFHVESFMEPAEISQPLTVFLEWVKTLIPKDKFAIFTSLFQFPTLTVQDTALIFNELERVFDGKNPANNYQFTDPSFKDDWFYYRKNNLHEPNIWRKKGWEAMKTAINSVLVVDLPLEQTSDRPEPYFYFLDISNVIDYEYIGGKVAWIAFNQPGKKVAFFDDKSYRILQLNDKSEVESIIVDKEHGLGYCPAEFFWSSPLTQKNPDMKKSPLSPQLGNLDWLLFFAISKKHLDLYAPYPIYSAYEPDCDFENNETGDYCDGGFLRGSDQNYKVLAGGTVEPCPVCVQKRIAGAGSFIDVPVPKTKDDVDLRNPITITTVDTDSLAYNVKEVERLKNEILTKVVGVGGEAQQKMSLNEMQVQANFESKTSVLNSLKGNFEAAMDFVDTTVCKLRYGDDFIGSSRSMGTEFYIYSVETLYAQYKQAKENGASEAELDAINDKILDTEYHNDPMKFERMLTLGHLEPYRHYTFDELMTMKEKGIVDEALLGIKINFNTFVNRFERENLNITEFGVNIPFDEKIEIITNKFKEYDTESRTVVS